MKRKQKVHWRLVKTHRNYTVDEAARLLQFSKPTIRRWIKSGALPALADRKPILILGGDLRDLLHTRSHQRINLQLNQWYCMRCRSPREAALGMADYLPLTTNTGNLRAVCCECTSLMHKAVSSTALAQFAGVLDIRLPEGSEHISDTPKPSLNDHLSKEPKSHA